MSVQRFDIDRRDYDDYDMTPSADGDWVKADSVKKLSVALADMIDMYVTKKRNSIRLGNARAALNLHGIAPVRPESEPGNQP